jgi:hypothetical protein
MIARKIGDALTTIAAVALSAAALYFGTAGAKIRPFILVMYAALFLFVAVKTWFDKEPLRIARRHWQRFYVSLAGMSLALFYLVQALMEPLNGWKSARMWIFGFSWLLLATRELHVFYMGESAQASQ